MASSSSFLATSFIFFTLLIRFAAAQMVPAVFVFGDSLVDVGNNNHLPVSIAKANFPHNGVDFPNKKATGRFSNGKNAADFLAEKVGLPTSPPYLSVSSKNTSAFMTGVSFASGGAGIFNGTDQSLGQSIPLTKQVGYYESVYGQLVQNLGASAAQNLLSKSLFAIVIGSNDIFGYSNSTDPKKGSPQEYVDLMTLTLKQLIMRIYGHGGRKFFISGVGPIGCCPSRRHKDKTGACNEDINSIAVLYNQKLKSMLQELNSELQGVSYSYFDTYTSLGNIIQSPATYGFVEVKSACCGLGTLKAQVPCLPIATYCSNRRDHVFWDLFHPIEAAARIIVDTLFDGPSQYTSPMNVRQLLAV
ncbi:zinc finger protein, putative [Ricinus communis]|uniref:Zinc finger protein, putative n=2 Tax=Ricinus communis TaxID=3988 RepID=B9SV91_RICCO|nr:zinc finger protein, putative [Ricinus communis]|eukprot:XP_002529910.1 GDSL esterase/lipase At5g55050 [Ricinus communis]